MQKTTLVRISVVLFALLTGSWHFGLGPETGGSAASSLDAEPCVRRNPGNSDRRHVVSYSAEAATPPIGAHVILTDCKWRC